MNRASRDDDRHLMVAGDHEKETQGDNDASPGQETAAFVGQVSCFWHTRFTGLLVLHQLYAPRRSRALDMDSKRNADGGTAFLRASPVGRIYFRRLGRKSARKKPVWRRLVCSPRAELRERP